VKPKRLILVNSFGKLRKRAFQLDGSPANQICCPDSTTECRGCLQHYGPRVSFN
jgi:hypothetical protein